MPPVDYCSLGLSRVGRWRTVTPLYQGWDRSCFQQPPPHRASGSPLSTLPSGGTRSPPHLRRPAIGAQGPPLAALPRGPLAPRAPHRPAWPPPPTFPARTGGLAARGVAGDPAL